MNTVYRHVGYVFGGGWVKNYIFGSLLIKHVTSESCNIISNIITRLTILF